MSIVFLVSVLVFLIAIAAIKPSLKGTIAVIAVILHSFMSTWLAVKSMGGNNYSEILYGGLIFGDIAVRLDPLSAWFVLLTNFTAITGILYGNRYLARYNNSSSDLSVHYAAYIINHAALTGIYFIQNSLAFLCSWELMALSAFMLVIFEHGRMDTLKAGINYLIQSHISIVLLTLGFIWVYTKTGSLDFNAIRAYGFAGGKGANLLLFMTFFTGFGIKAGFVPFHTWLPYAHPAAPSHVSGVMSGVIIKTGIYGILRVILLMPDNKLAIGYIILAVSVLSGLYGVLLAIVQHNLKRLLAYHSIENIGIIGIGIGVGTIGSGLNNPYLTFTGYAGALLHILNHSLFKSLLFYTAGSVYQALHTLSIDRMGGLIKKMPKTAALFLLASLAICGLPPLNGFVSEFLIYSGLFSTVVHDQTPVTMVLTIVGLSLIGGLAILCFTKAFGIVFQGSERKSSPVPVQEVSEAELFPKYLIALVIVLIGLFPQIFIRLLQKPVSSFITVPFTTEYSGLITLMQNISLTAWVFLVIVVLITVARKVFQNKTKSTQATWGCAYKTNSPKLQYTATSFVRPYVKIIKPILFIKKSDAEITQIIPEKIYSESHFYDKIENTLVDWPTRNLRGFLGKFKFLQNGSVQFYVLYGVVFIGICIAIPLIINGLIYLTDILKQL
jgi:hydrogenase-4 component B